MVDVEELCETRESVNKGSKDNKCLTRIHCITLGRLRVGKAANFPNIRKSPDYHHITEVQNHYFYTNFVTHITVSIHNTFTKSEIFIHTYIVYVHMYYVIIHFHSD